MRLQKLPASFRFPVLFHGAEKKLIPFKMQNMSCRAGRGDIMGNHNYGHSHFPVDFLKQGVQFSANQEVESGKRLIKYEEFFGGAEGTGKKNTPLLSA